VESFAMPLALKLVERGARPLSRSVLCRARPMLMQQRWNQQAPAQSHIFADDDALRRQLLYRSKQRGWLEMDIMLGDWVRGRLRNVLRCILLALRPNGAL